MKSVSVVATFVLSLALFLAVFFLCFPVGPGDFTFFEILSVFFGKTNPTSSNLEDLHYLLFDLRLPRQLLASLTGASLAVAGALTQGYFRNPLADPSVLGISAGSALAVIFSIFIGLDLDMGISVDTLFFPAAGGAFISIFLLFTFSRFSSGPGGLLLSGVALSSFFVSAIQILLGLLATRQDLNLRANQWLLGSFEGRGWEYLYFSLPFFLIGLFVAVMLIKSLDAMFLGRDVAQTLGFSLGQLTIGMMISVVLLVGISSAVAGPLGFVGLLVPHLVRRFSGASHGRLIAFSIPIGAAFMVLIDTLSRASSHLYLPPGAISGIPGGIFFLFLLKRKGYSRE